MDGESRFSTAGARSVMLHGRVIETGRREEALPGDEAGADTARPRCPEAAAPQGGTGPARRGRSGVGAERREEGTGTVALAVRNSASWLMLETSGELFMITRIRDRGSDTSRFSPPLDLAAIFPPRPAPSPRRPARAVRPPRRAGSCSLRPPRGTPRCRRRDYNSRRAARPPPER